MSESSKPRSSEAVGQIQSSAGRRLIPFLVPGVLLAGMAAQVLAYSWLSGLGSSEDESVIRLIRGAVAHRLHILEWLLLVGVALWCLARKNRAWMWLVAVACGFFLVVQSAQFLSFYFTQQFLTRDAFQNAQHVGLLVSPFTITVALLPVALTTLVAVIALKSRSLAVRIRDRVVASVVLVFVGLSLVIPSAVDRSSLPASSGLPPVAAFARLLVVSDQPIWFDLNENDLGVVQELGFSINPKSRYPLIKNTIYSDPAPFGLGKQGSEPNLIVFFVESLSARKLSIYGSPYPGISPNIEEFADHAMVVENYFSHTAATYRGLRGQLCSMYPFFGGVGAWFDPNFEPPKTRLLGLPHLMNQSGYHTVLLGANTIEKARMNVQAEAVGFSDSMLKNQISRDLLGEEPVQGSHLSDSQMMRALWTLLDTGRLNKPFFVFMYNVGTHTHLNSRTDGVTYGDGQHNVLNTTFSFDHSFGWFWQRFLESPLAENTIVVLTADHAHFPTPAFVEVAGQDYRKVFFDRIPLVIYHPYLELPERFDPGVSTSLDFAPSMAHLLNLPNQKNPFLGRSIFDERSPDTKSGGLGEYGETLCLIDSAGRMSVFSTAQTLPPRAASLARFVELTQYAELNDRLWDGFPGRFQKEPERSDMLHSQ